MYFIMCDEIVESYVEYGGATLYDNTNFNERKQPVKYKIFIFYLHFFKFLYIINSCWYLLLLDKISNKKCYYHFITQIMN